MTVYFAVLFVVFFNIFFDGRVSKIERHRFGGTNLRYGLIFILLFIFIGFRKEIGVDWENYLNIYEAIGAGGSADSKFFLFSILLIQYLDLPWYYINVFCALIFLIGLYIFILSLPRPGLALLYCIPYFIFVIALGYTRQSAAIGLFLLSFYFLKNGRYFIYSFFILCASLFHASAILLIAIPFWIERKNSTFVLLAVPFLFIASLIAYKFLPVEALLVRYFQESGLHSKGAQARLLVYSVISTIFMLSMGKLNIGYRVRSSFVFLLLLNPILFLSTFMGMSTTAADRIAIYTFPAQMAFFSFFPDLIRSTLDHHRGWLFGVLFVAIILFVLWISFTIYSSYWFPYKNFLFAWEF